MTTLLTADEHYGHRRIIEYCKRPFTDVDHMTQELVARHNAVVGPDDTVIHVGDFVMNERSLSSILPRLHGRHVLVMGNHDRCHPCRKDHVAARGRYLAAGFVEVVESMVLGDMLVHHMPYSGDDREKYHQYRPKDDGRALLHGHIHERWKTRGRMVNVGVDVRGYAPVALEAIVEEVKCLR
jgi:calcineurin-like phosphoesterase family protein